ncbi:MAG: NAD(P)-dependent oxidoreductase [ANME-2 cluster archaeon]|nr:NAD(P)-dependent oxidoreductase [ANME-2 cluster archaeon]
MKILITGSSGLIASAIIPFLEADGHIIRGFDIRPSPSGNNTSFIAEDITDSKARQNAIKDIDGVIHLAAVSRVLDAEQDPAKCFDINVKGTMSVLSDLAKLDNPPWVIYGSSREVYGFASTMPVSEEQSLKPVNIYAESKVASESLIRNYARLTNRPAIILRFSNVYGSIHDHATRVIPAFVRASVTGNEIRIDGEDHTFDFTHVDDIARTIRASVEHIEDGTLAGIETMNVVSGKGTTLKQLANLVKSISGAEIPITRGIPRNFDVDHFIGDPSHLEDMLGICCDTPLSTGIERLMNDFRASINIRDITATHIKTSHKLVPAAMQEASL